LGEAFSGEVEKPFDRGSENLCNAPTAIFQRRGVVPKSDRLQKFI
jgi:hypothetical protein